MRHLHSLLLVVASYGLAHSGFSNAQSIDVSMGGASACVIDANQQLECSTVFNANQHLPPNDGTTYTDVSVGGGHSCAITTEGSIRCWGANTFGQITPPINDVPFVRISAGENHSCATDENRQIHCWGLNTNEQLNVPAGENFGFTLPYAGQNGSCGIRDNGQALCWSNEEGVNDIDPNTQYIDLVVGGSNREGCGLRTDGIIECWFMSPHTPVSIPSSGPYTAIESNFAMLCGLTESGAIDCEANDFMSSRLDDDARADIAAFEVLPPLQSFEIAGNNLVTGLCGIGFDDNVYCSGSNLPFNQLANFMGNEESVESLEADIYSENTIELMWDFDRAANRQFRQVVGFNIYRDDRLLTFTSNGSSYIDDTLQPGVDYAYSITVVDPSGNESVRSDVLTVNTDVRITGSVTEPTVSEPTPSNPTASSASTQIEALTFTRYDDNLLELFWGTGGLEGVRRYEVYRNGVLVATVSGASYFDNAAPVSGNWHYTVVALDTNANIRGIGFVNAQGLGVTECR